MNAAIIIFPATLLFIVLLWMEFRRQNRNNRFLRMLASAILCISLSLLFLPVFHTVQNQKTVLFLLDKGYSEDSVQSVRNWLSTHQTEKGSATFEFRNITLGDNPDADLLRISQEVGLSIHYFGFGMDSSRIKLLQNHEIHFHLSVPGGICSVDWPRKVSEGQKIILSGTYRNFSSLPVKFILSGFGKDLDSIILKAPNAKASDTKKTLPIVQPFSLEFIARINGRIRYQLRIIKGDQIEIEPVPIEVFKSQTERILLLASSPGFENKFLKNAFQEAGYQLALQFPTSKTARETEYINMPELSFKKINAEILNHFDLLICDATVFNGLQYEEKNEISKLVYKGKLGIVFRIDTPSDIRGLQAEKYFGIKPPLLNIGKSDLSQSNITLVPSELFRPVMFDKKSRITASEIISGRGKIVFTTIGDTFPLWLAGNKKAYFNLWSTLTETAMPGKELDNIIQFDPFPFTNKRMKIYLKFSEAGSQTAPVIFDQANEKLYTNQHYFSNQWEAFYWPFNPGWQAFSTNLRKTAYWTYVFSPGEWSGPLEMKQKKESLEFFSRNKTKNAKIRDHLSSNNEILQVLFIVSLLFSLFYLIIERKMQ